MPSEGLPSEIQVLSMVVVGHFNPAIFHPSWFSRISFFSETEIDQALGEFQGVVHKDMSQFNIDWCNILIEPKRMIVSTRMDAYFERLRDLLSETFRELIHTPIKAVGINPEGEFKVSTFEKWDSFGNRLAPKADWGGIVNNPKLRELIIEDKPRNDEFTGYTSIKVRPSEIPSLENGINIHMNDHFSFVDAKPADGAAPLLEVLEKGYPNTMNRWEHIHQHLTSLI